MPDVPIRLTSLAHGGGCGCKIAPPMLTRIMASLPATSGIAEESADARRSIASTRSRRSSPLPTSSCRWWTTLSTSAGSPRPTPIRTSTPWGEADPGAGGGGMPVDALPVETIRAVLAGGASVCAQAGIPVAGGHSIDSPEPIYGLVALGLVHPDRVKRSA